MSDESGRLPGCTSAEEETIAANLGVNVNRLRDAKRYPAGLTPEDLRQDFAATYGLRAEFLPLTLFQEGGRFYR